MILFGGAPAGVVALGEPEVLGDAVHVRVDRDDQARGRDGPEAEVDAVGGADHPAQVEEETLHGAPGARIGHEMAERARRARSAEPVSEAGEPLP